MAWTKLLSVFYTEKGCVVGLGGGGGGGGGSGGGGREFTESLFVAQGKAKAVTLADHSSVNCPGKSSQEKVTTSPWQTTLHVLIAPVIKASQGKIERCHLGRPQPWY